MAQVGRYKKVPVFYRLHTIKLEYGIKHQNIRNFLLVKKQI